MTIEEMRTIDATKTYKELEEARARIAHLEDRIKRLEEAGDDLESWLDRNTPFTIRNNWSDAKEAKL